MGPDRDAHETLKFTSDGAQRARLRSRGEALRRQLGIGDEVHGAPAPGYPELSDELVFGAIWCRDGLPLPDRMIATLAVLGGREHNTLIPEYVAAALRVGLLPDAIREVFIQAGLYAGFQTAESALRAAESVFEAQGLGAEDPTAADGMSTLSRAGSLDAAGQAKMNELHGERSAQGYAAPDHPITGALYALAKGYGYGVLWNRAGLSRRERFICAIAAFTALELDTQLAKFAQSARAQDLSQAELVEIIMQTAPYAGFPRALNALAKLAPEALSPTS